MVAVLLAVSRLARLSATAAALATAAAVIFTGGLCVGCREQSPVRGCCIL